jgi:hypothetical protein
MANHKKTYGRLEEHLKQGKYYEAQQLYRTLYSRMVATENYTDAAALMLQAASKMFQYKQGNSGGDLALNVIDCWTKAQEKLSDEKTQTILSLFNEFPKGSEDAKISFMKQALLYTEKFGASTLGEPKLHAAFAKFYWTVLEYGTSQKHYLRANCPAEHANMLFEWSQKGLKSEIDLFIARSVLQYLCLENLAGANAILEAFSKLCPKAVLDTPLMHFIQFLLRTVERDASPLFQLLRTKYQPSIERDSIFTTYLNKIGEVYFDIKQPQGMLSNIMDVFK